MFRALLILPFLVLATAAPAQVTHVGTFDVYLAGLRAGVLGISGIEDGGRYSAAGKLQTSGLLALIREVSYDARSTGRVTSKGYVPSLYQETANTGSRQSQAEMAYVAGTPQLKVYNPPQDRGTDALDPATQKGTLDPMTTIYSLLKDVPRDATCKLDVFMFDGKRRSRVTTSDPKPDGDALVCSGTYRRIAGFSEKEMAEKSVFPFRLTYSPAENGMFRVTRVVFDTLYGKATLVRQ